MAAKRDLYEVLEISPDADDAELKKAYRRAALKWHPDKNQDNLEEASVRFKEVQEAYETLSDPQERAWYDDHKDDILHGSLGDENKEPGVDPEDLNLKSYCSASAYLSDPAEFFVVYSKLFNTLDEIEERAFGETDDNDDEDSNAKRKQQQRSYRHAPPFGSADSDYDDVKDFYSHYLNFVTYRSFSWADKWQLPTAPSRHIRRLMAKENRKEREKARKTYCDDIRAVLEFVRKHDPRVKQHKKKLKEEAKLKEAEAKRAKAEEKKRRAKERKEHLAHEFERMQLQKEARRQMYGDEAVEDSAEDEDEEEEQDFHCVVCEKSFRSEGAWRNHEKSKLHKKNVAALQKEQRKHGTLSLDEESQEEADTDADSTRKGKKNRRKKGKKAKRMVEDDEDHKHDSDSEDSDAAGSSDGDDYFPGDLLLECEKGHKLVFTSDRGAAYAGESEWDCNRCAGSKSGKSYHCSQCLFDMCKRCAREHQKLASLSKFTTAAVVTDDHVADVDMDADAAETMSESKHSAKDEFECSTCQVTFLSKAKMKAHKRSAAHKLKMMQVGSTGDSTSTPSETVHAGADADADADADVATETDSVADNAASNDGSDKKTASSAFDCAVCSMSFKSAHKLKAHKRTTIHKKKLQEKEAAVDEDLKQELNNIDSGLAADDNDDDDDGGRKKKKTRGQSDPSKASDKAQRKAEQEIRQKKREQEEEDEAAQTDSKPAMKAASKAASKAAPAGSSAADKSQDKGKKRPQGKAERKR